jgi:hypothetical protein
VSDEYVARYQGLSHEQLWTQLQAGDPGQVDALAVAWRSLHDRADALATSLTHDLGRLTAGWSSSAGTEYQNRLALIASFSSTLANGFADRHRELTLMAGALRTAQRQAEDPASTDTNDHMLIDAGIGFAIAGPVGGVVGGLLGHSQDEAEERKARQRMVQLVAGLAADYGVTTDIGWTTMVPLPPDGMPSDSTSGARYDAESGPRGASTGSVGATGTASGVHRTVSDPDEVSPAPRSGAGLDQQNGTVLGPDGRPIDPVTALAGAGGLAGAVAAGLGALTASPVVGAGGAGTLGTAALGAGHPLGGAASGAGTNTGSAPGDPGGRDRGAAGSRFAGRQSAANSVGDDGEEPDERMTWLTEDDMVWGAEGAAAPPVLGQRPRPEQDPA